MSRVTDEMLMAFVDGELPPAEAERLAAAIEADPELRERLKPFELTRSELAPLFAEPLAEPVPDRLIAAVMAAGARRTRGVQGQGASGGESWLARIRELLFPDFSFGPAPALAALVLFVAGAGAGVMLGRTNSSPLGSGEAAGSIAAAQPVAEGLLRTALEKVPSLETLAARGITVEPKVTFRAAGGRLCRQYEIAVAQGGHSGGVACRTPNGAWTIAFHTDTKAPVAQSADDYRTAGEATGPVDAKVDAMKVGDVLGPDDERRLTGNGWGFGTPGQ